MTTYTTRETTPLKFHKFIWYVWQPFSLLSALITAIGAITKFLGYLSLSSDARVLILVILGCLMEVAFVLSPALIFIGFFKWKNYAWYILMYLSISNILFSTIMLPFRAFEIFSFLGKIFGIAMDVIIAIYYWNRRLLFNVHLPKQKKKSPIKETPPVVPPGSSPVEGQNYCRFCGNKLPPESVFCSFCGKKL